MLSVLEGSLKAERKDGEELGEGSLRRKKLCCGLLWATVIVDILHFAIILLKSLYIPSSETW